MNSPANAQMLSTCFWIVFGVRFDIAKCSRNGRNSVTSCSPGGRSFSRPIHERGQLFRSRQYCSSPSRGVAAARVILVGFAVAISHFLLQLLTILHPYHRLPGFISTQPRLRSPHRALPPP